MYHGQGPSTDSSEPVTRDRGEEHVVGAGEPVEQADERRVGRRDGEHARYRATPRPQPEADHEVQGRDHDPEVADDELEELELGEAG